MDEHDIAVRVEALELAFKSLKAAQQEPLLALIDWASKEQLNELGRTRGTLLALKAFARAMIAAGPDRQAFAPALETYVRQAEADLVLLQLPERSMSAAAEGLAETAEALRRSCVGS